MYTFDWYDGPRSGVADCNGRPYFFESQWADIGSSGKDWYMLSPIPAEVFVQETEYWNLWKRYEAGHAAGMIGAEHHPFLPADRPRGEALVRILEGQLKIDSKNHLIAQAEFLPMDKYAGQNKGAEMWVYWKILPTPPSESRKVDYDF
ncbi:hypothetical protein [Hymenobacter glaciei]|uniref:hypothetical protein n=1 Tax=Hymenobacter glaciei TaxID=877209 RepID=UPI0031ECB8D7